MAYGGPCAESGFRWPSGESPAVLRGGSGGLRDNSISAYGRVYVMVPTAPRLEDQRELSGHIMTALQDMYMAEEYFFFPPSYSCSVVV